MGRGIIRALVVIMALVVFAGCASPGQFLKGKEQLEAKDWLHAGDIAYKLKDWDTAQYYYDLLVKKYPDSYYGKKAAENLKYVDYQRSGIGRAIGKGVEELEPIL